MNKIIMFSIVSVLLTSCSSKREIRFNSGKEGLSLTLNSTGFRSPVNFIEKADSGLFYYDTPKGRTWIGAEPDSKNEGDHSLTLTWKSGSHEITLGVVKSEDFEVTLKALPDDDILGWGINIGMVPDEFISGLFERTVDGNQKNSWKEGIQEAMDLRGQAVDMIIKPTLSLYCPFYISSENYGLFVKGTWPGHYDIGKETKNMLQISFEGPSLDFTVYTGKDITSIVKKHSLNVGPAFLPPKWAFSTWRWRDNHTNQKMYFDSTKVTAPYNSMVVEDILMMRALGIPFGAYWVDRPWAKGAFGYDDFEWDTQRFPHPEKMLDWFTRNNIPFMLWIAPWVSGKMKNTAQERHYDMAMKNSYVDTSKISLLDLTNPEAVEWWQNEGLAKVLKQGVRGFKLDRSEEIVPESREIMTYDKRTTREIRNEFPVLYIKAVNEICQKIHPDDFMIFPRAGYTNSSRYGGFWGGDIGSPQEGLRTAIIAAQRSALIGYPIWGSDIGGYWHGDLDREVTARWLEFGCFTPLMEVGPTEDRAFWDMKTEPHYDTELLAVWRMYAIIHTRLMDYSYKAAQEAHNTGMPVIRPLLMLYPAQAGAREDWQTFMYGPDILVSAIWEKNTASQKVYLPEGEMWTNAWDTTMTFEGGQFVEVSTPVYKMPVFIRKGSGVNLGDLDSLYKSSLEAVSIKPDLKKLEMSEKF